MKLGILVFALCLVFTGCSGLTTGRIDLDLEMADMGMASWYGKDFHALRTATGEMFDMYAVSAAHRTLPLGSLVQILNVQNGQSLTVRINDRGPYVRGRIIDVSYGAAEKLGMVEGGLAPVYIKVVENRMLVENATSKPLLLDHARSDTSSLLLPQFKSRSLPADVIPYRRQRVSDACATTDRIPDMWA